MCAEGARLFFECGVSFVSAASVTILCTFLLTKHCNISVTALFCILFLPFCLRHGDNVW